MDLPLFVLSVIVFLPALGALCLAFFPKGADDAIRWFTLVICGAVFVISLWAFLGGGDRVGFDLAQGTMQSVFNVSWIPSFNIYYFMGIDGISLPLVVLTSFISTLAAGASWSITKQVKGYSILFLLLVTGMLGVFMALDFFLFYVFWEVMLLPMYFLIGVWGGPRREYAAIKFFLYTLLGSVLMLVALLLLYFNSDLRQLAKVSDLNGNPDAAVVWEELHVHPDVTEEVLADLDGKPVHTFNLLALAAIGQHTDAFVRGTRLGPGGEEIVVEKSFLGLSLAVWAFLLLLIGFLIKVPSVPVHTWLPDAHVEAPTPISMILAGILLKMGGYGIIRICYPICPQGGYDLAYVICAIGLVSMVYGAFAAMAQTDFKRLVAYSSVSHMGYVVLGLGVWSLGSWAPETMYNGEYWNMGIKGAMFQMIGHGISSAGMFFMVGVIYDRVHHRNLNEFGGLMGKMPVYTALSMGIFFAGLGLPGLCGFIGEVFVVLSVWKFSTVMAVIAAAVVVLTAGYILWAIQRVYLGAEYKGPHEEALTDIVGSSTSLRELAIASTLFVFAILFGVFPHTFALRYMDATIDRQVEQLADWTREHDLQEVLARREAQRQEALRSAQRSAAPAAEQDRQAAAPPATRLRPAEPFAPVELPPTLTSTEPTR